MGVPGSKIWSNLQLLSLFQSKYLKCDDCYDDNDGSQGLRVDTGGGDVTASTKAKKYIKQKKTSWDILLSKEQKQLSLQPSSLYIFTQIIYCFVQYFRLEDGENMDI